jgi:hypothetical protein
MKENKMNNSVQQPKRPQDPKPPFPYDIQEVSYENKSAGITLSGTLTLPRAQGPFPAVLLIAGMGPVDRNGEGYYGLKPLLVLADYLTRHGIAVLRFDKRGVGKSTGTFDTTVTCPDLADDVLAGIEFLKSCKTINPHQIGLIGHSEGGLVAAMVTAQSNDVAFVILMSGAVVNQTHSLVEHAAFQLRADGATEHMIQHDGLIRAQILDILKTESDTAKAEKQKRSSGNHRLLPGPLLQKRLII